MASRFWILLALCVTAPAVVSSQEEEEYCYSGQWFLDLGLCFLQKYVDMLMNLESVQSSHMHTHDTRRSLQAVLEPIEPLVNIVGNTDGVPSTVERLASTAKRMHDQYLNDAVKEVVTQKVTKGAAVDTKHLTRGLPEEYKKRIDILDKIIKVDMEKVVHGLSEEAISLLYRFQAAAVTLFPPEEIKAAFEAMDKNPNITLGTFQFSYGATPYKDITDIFDILPGLIPALPLACALCPGFLCPIPNPWDDIFCDDRVQEILDLLTPALTCFGNYNEEDFEDGVEWLGCLFECGDLPAMGQCVRSVSATCDSPLVGDLVLEVAVEYLFGLGAHANGTDCKLHIPTDPITVTEGGDMQHLAVYSYMPHTLYCLDLQVLNTPLGLVGLLVDWIMDGFGQCNVQIQVSTHNYLYPILSFELDVLGFVIDSGWPRCRDGSLVNQALIARHEFDGDCACSVALGDNSWNESHVFPIAAGVDNKLDRDVEAELTVKLRVKGRTVQSQKITLNIWNRDIADPLCISLGDPHITTFDGTYYDNYYEGYFHLYKHQSLPYEVQVIQQNCTSETPASCTCAVAVRSGDDVFLIDKCRSVGSDDVPPTTIAVLLNGDLNPGTRIFNKEDGHKWEVVLPIGTTVTLLMGEENSINVWIAGATTDRTPDVANANDTVRGLCGTFDGNDGNDFVKPDGTTASDEADFIDSWRVEEEDLLFDGALADPSLPQQPEFCRCMYILYLGVHCQCGYDQIVDLCDFDTDGEMTASIQEISRQSDKQRLADGLEANWPRPEPDIRHDFASTPPAGWDGNRWTLSEAEDLCDDALSQDPTVAECVANVGGFTRRSYANEDAGCVEDIRISNSTAFVAAAVESAKMKCYMKFSQRIGIFNTAFRPVETVNCLNDCNGHGVCINSTCECDPEFEGSSCSMATSAPSDVTFPTMTTCDTRGGACGYVTLLGYGFRPSEKNVSCVVQQNELIGSSQLVQHPETRQNVVGTVISESQVACPLPTDCLLDEDLCTGSQAFGALYRVEVEGSSLAPEVLVYDSACYACSMSGPSCSLKDTNDYCLIDSACYTPQTYKFNDSCSWCDPTQSKSDWTVYPSQPCIDAFNEEVERLNAEDRERTVRIVVACVASATVVLVALALYLTIGRTKSAKNIVEAGAHPDKPSPSTSSAGDEVQVDADTFMTDTGVTLVKKVPNGEVNDGFDFEHVYDNADVYENEAPAVEASTSGASSRGASASSGATSSSSSETSSTRGSPRPQSADRAENSMTPVSS